MIEDSHNTIGYARFVHAVLIVVVGVILGSSVVLVR